MSQFPDDEIVAEESDAPAPVAQPHECESPSRARRAVFVFGSWLLAFGAMVFFARSGIENGLTKTLVDGCSMYLIAVAGFYIAGHSFDRSTLSRRMGSYLGEK